MLTLGTGIGGGLILGGRPYRGWIGAGAELGHMVIDHDGAPCRALRRATAISSRSRPERPPTARRAGCSGRRRTRTQLVAAARGGDEEALEALATEMGDVSASGIASLVNIFNPELIVIGGGFGGGARPAARAGAGDR